MAYTDSVDIGDAFSDIGVLYVSTSNKVYYDSLVLDDATVDYGDLYISSGGGAFYGSLVLDDPTVECTNTYVGLEVENIFSDSASITEFALPVFPGDDSFLIANDGLEAPNTVNFVGTPRKGRAPLVVDFTPIIYEWDIYG